MGIIEELWEIQKTVKLEHTSKEREIKEKEVVRETEEKHAREIKLADADIPQHLEEIKVRARDYPFRTETTLSLGIISRDYAARTAENLKKLGFVCVLKSRYHYGDNDRFDKYTTYTLWVNWKSE